MSQHEQTGHPEDAAREQLQQSIVALFERAKVGEPATHGGLSIFPIFIPDGHQPRYILLDEALRQELARITEANESGSVPELLIENLSDLPILILEGDVLIGAKQNRVVNLTVLVPPKVRFTLPVSCVERGRWNYVSQHFSIKRSAHPDLRGAKISSVLHSRKHGGKPRSDQMEVWDKVDHCLSDLQADSMTDSLEDGYSANEGKLSAYRNKLHLPPEATGYLVAVGEKIIGLDLFGEAATARRCWGRLSESYFLEALRSRGEAKLPEPGSANDFLARVNHSARVCPEAVGLGHEIEVEAPDLAGMGLAYEGRLVHLAAFALTES